LAVEVLRSQQSAQSEVIQVEITGGSFKTT